MSARAGVDRHGNHVVFVKHKRERKTIGHHPITKKHLTKRDAVALATQIREAQRTALPAAAAPTVDTRIVFTAFSDQWLDDRGPNLKVSMRKFYRYNLDSHVQPALGTMPVADITRQVAERFAQALMKKKAQRSGKPLARKTREGALATLCVVMQAAVSAHLVPANPALRLDVFTFDPNEVPKAISLWTRDQANHALDVARVDCPQWYPFLVTLVRAGLRIGEALEVRWTDMEAHQPDTLHLQRQWSELTPDGQPTRGHVTTLKATRANRDGSRYVDLTPHVVATLKAHKIAMKAAALRAGRPFTESDLIFQGARGCRLHPSNIQDDILDPLIKSAKVPRVSPHGLRHTYATTLLLERGHKVLQYVSEQMGHADVETTLRIYVHYVKDTTGTPAVHSLDDAGDQVAVAPAAKGRRK